MGVAGQRFSRLSSQLIDGVVEGCGKLGCRGGNPNFCWIGRRLLIQEKYSEYGRGLLSYEVEMALRHWLALHTKTQNLKETKEAVKPNPTPKAAIIFAEVKNYLLTHYYMEPLPGQQIPRKHLEEAIMAVRGTDSRTIEKWLKTFHKMGLIKPITTATWEII